MKSVVVMVAAALFTSGGTFKDGLGTVNAGVLCTDISSGVAAVKKSQQAITKWAETDAIKFCFDLGGAEGMNIPIKRVVSGPHKGFDGIDFYVVEVNDGLFALAWPGLNSDMVVGVGL